MKDITGISLSSDGEVMFLWPGDKFKSFDNVSLSSKKRVMYAVRKMKYTGIWPCVSYAHFTIEYKRK